MESFVTENGKLFERVKGYSSGDNPKFKLSVIYHSVPASVIRSPLYRSKFMTKFGPETIHVLDCAETNLVQNIRSKAFH